MNAQTNFKNIYSFARKNAEFLAMNSHDDETNEWHFDQYTSYLKYEFASKTGVFPTQSLDEKINLVCDAVAKSMIARNTKISTMTAQERLECERNVPEFD